MDGDFTWLVKSATSLKSFQNLPLRLDSKFFAFENDGGVVKIREIFKISPDLELSSNMVYLWHPKSGLIRNKKEIWQRRNDLKGLALKAAIKHVSSAQRLYQGFNIMKLWSPFNNDATKIGHATSNKNAWNVF